MTLHLSADYLMISETGIKKILHLYDYQNDLMPLVILVIKYIKGDDDLEEKRHKKQLKNNHLPEYSFPKPQRVGGW